MGKSVIYQRVLEELRAFVADPKASAILSDCLDEQGVTAESATGYDIRMILLDSLPRRLSLLVAKEQLPAVIKALEFALVDMHHPKPGRSRRATKKSYPRVI